MITRRRFIEDSLLATAAAAVSKNAILTSSPPSKSSDDAIHVAIIGCRIRGRQHATEFARIPACKITHVCDPDADLVAELARQVEKLQGTAPEMVDDMRRIFDNSSVHAVSIATPNHWHALAAIWAMQSGKDVYVEKPVSHNVSEGRRIVEIARQTGRICQTGTQRRSEGPVAAAMEYIRQGKLGEVKLARSIVYGRRDSIGGPGGYPIPSSVDYDLWAGPAPMSPLTRPKFHYDWHWFWETGNGELGNNNIHMVDVCRWGLGVTGPGRAVLSYGGRFGYKDAGETPNTQVVIHDFDTKTIVQEVRGLKTDKFKFDAGWIFYGSLGIVAGTSLFDRDGKLVRTFDGPGENHFANFLSAVRGRRCEDLKADISEGHQSTALCHIGNISYRLGRPASPSEVLAELDRLAVIEDVRETFERMRRHLADNGINIEQEKLTLGPVLFLKEGSDSFISNKDADQMLTREYREPFVVPGN